MQSHPDAVKMMSFFPYGDDVRALDSPPVHIEPYYNIEYQNKENLWL